jgi:penicillin amidase
VPAQNVVYADVEGNIGYRASGKVPIRRDGKGFLPYRGWESAGDWIGYIPFEEMPRALNPAPGFIATANNLMLASSFSYYLSNSWEPTSRIERITEMLQSNAKADTAYMKTVQLDQFSKHAQYTLPRLLKLMEADTSLAASDTTLTLQEKQALGLLRQWDYIENAESVAATLYNVWSLEFLQATIKDEMGDTLFQNYVQWSSLAIRALEYFAEHPQSPWFDDRATEERENGRHIARRALRATLQRLQEKFGELMGDWQWGQLHQLTLEHPFGKQKPLDVIFNVGPLPMGGSPSTVNKGEYNFAKPYAVNSGPSMRRIVDLAHPETCLSIIPGGQSGQPLDPHYKDQIALWWKGQYRQVSMEMPRVAASAREVLRLQP